MTSFRILPLVLYFIFFAVTNSTAIHLTKDIKPIVSGTVYSKNAEVIIGAYIQVEGTNIYTSTDLDGKFSLYNISNGVQVLKISSLGYKTILKTIEIIDNTPLIITITFEEDALIIPEVLIMGKTDRLFSRVPGSASYINTEQIKLINPLSGNEILKRSPGLHVVDEEGAGLRANIGIRGLDPDRSRSLLVLEDGIPVALAPYGEPEMYYTPSIDRMSGIEILKGSGQILYGPQTIGGVINYLTYQPPAEAAGKLKIQTGQGNLWNGLLNYGNTHGKIGYNITMLKKRAEKLGLTRFDITDINAKLVINFNEKSMIFMKAGFYKEQSNATYIGLTQTMYDAGNQDFVHMAPNDQLKINRYSFSLQHSYKWTNKTQLKTSLFTYATSRNWRRQDFISNSAGNVKPSNWTGVTWGDEAIVGGAVYMRSSTGNRNRQFEVAGLETGLIHTYESLDLTHKLKVGIRYLYEKAYEQRINGTKPNVNSGVLAEDEERPGNALSVYLQQLTNLRNNLELHYGVRMEHFGYGRNIYRRSFVINNLSQIRDTVLNNSNQLTQLIPGAGFTWTALTGLRVFGGLHAGFAPPRTKDAISNVGEVYKLSAEKSLNLELGLRSNPINGIQMELTAFRMNFSNQVIPVSESSGGTGVGLVNGGSTLHQGVESALQCNVSELLALTKTTLTLHSSITYIDAHFTGDRTQNGERLSGNNTPYAPNWLINSAITLETISGLSLRLGSNFVAKQYSDELNTNQAAPDGRSGIIPAYHTLDGNISYAFKKWNTVVSVSVKNMTDERYIVSRRPQGIRLGLPRWVTIGAEYSF